MSNIPKAPEENGASQQYQMSWCFKRKPAVQDSDKKRTNTTTHTHTNPYLSEVWTRVLWILRVLPDKRAFSRAGMFVCQPWLWLDTFRHHQFRGITSIKGITSISSSTGITSSHECGFARHTSLNKTDSYLFPGLLRILRAFSGFCGPSPVLRAFSGFACSPNLCVLAHFYLYLSKKKKAEKALSTWEKRRYLTVKMHIGFSPGYRAFSAVFFPSSFFFSGRFPPPRSRRPDRIPCLISRDPSWFLTTGKTTRFHFQSQGPRLLVKRRQKRKSTQCASCEGGIAGKSSSTFMSGYSAL